MNLLQQPNYIITESQEVKGASNELIKLSDMKRQLSEQIDFQIDDVLTKYGWIKKSIYISVEDLGKSLLELNYFMRTQTSLITAMYFKETFGQINIEFYYKPK